MGSTIFYMEGFDTYNQTTSDFEIGQVGTGAFGGGSLHRKDWTGFSPDHYQVMYDGQVSSGVKSVRVGAYFRSGDVSNHAMRGLYIFGFHHYTDLTATRPIMVLATGTNGGLEIWPTFPQLGSTPYVTGPNVLAPAGQWSYIEYTVMFDAHTFKGAYLRVDKLAGAGLQSVMSVGITTGISDPSEWRMRAGAYFYNGATVPGSGGTLMDMWWDDIVGISETDANDTPTIGTRRIYSQLPVGDSYNGNWTAYPGGAPSTALDDLYLDIGGVYTDYVYTDPFASIGNHLWIDHADLTGYPDSYIVPAVQTRQTRRLAAAGDPVHLEMTAWQTSPFSITAYGMDSVFSTANGNRQIIIETNPNTGTPWTVEKVSITYFGPVVYATSTNAVQIDALILEVLQPSAPVAVATFAFGTVVGA